MTGFFNITCRCIALEQVAAILSNLLRRGFKSSHGSVKCVCRYGLIILQDLKECRVA